MSVENPTAEGGASITERIEQYLSAGEQPEGKPGQSAPETPEVEAEATASGEPEQAEETQLSLSDVAKVLGVEESALDVDEDGSLKIKTKVDGKEGAAKFQELIKSYQLQGHVDAKAREAAEIHRHAQERAQQFEAYAQQQAQQFAHILQSAQQVIAGEFGSVNWDELSRNDPVGYVEKRHQYEQRMGQLQQIHARAQQEAANFVQAQNYRQQQTLMAEAQRLVQLVPEWTNETVRNSETAQMREWLSKKGASPETIAGIRDAALVASLRVAMLSEANQSKTAAVEKKVRAAPKLVKPGQATTAGEKNAEGLRALKQTIRESGGKRGIAEYLIASGKV